MAEKITVYDEGKRAFVEKEKVRLSPEEWRTRLSPEQYSVARARGTEAPFSACAAPPKAGVYACVCCGNDLFVAADKFESGTGWPSFVRPVSEHNVRYEPDVSHGMVRTEVLCALCDAHLGHVFPDGPPPTGKRYCINSVCLSLRQPGGAALESAVFGAGCFWGVEAAFAAVPGVVETGVGYCGGTVPRPTYEMVCTGRTGHAEAVRVVFDPKKISYRELLERFWAMHDPTTPDRQGPDVGPQYRSVVFYADEKQKKEALGVKSAVERRIGRAVVTQIVPAAQFYRAEEYHQRYYAKHGLDGGGGIGGK